MSSLGMERCIEHMLDRKFQDPASNFELWRARRGRVRIGSVGPSCQLQVDVRTYSELRQRMIDEIEPG